MPKILEIEKEGYGRYMFVGTGATRKRLWVPDWARWTAQDKDGTWTWFAAKPDAGNTVWGLGGMSEFAYKSQNPRSDWESMLYRVY